MPPNPPSPCPSRCRGARGIDIHTFGRFVRVETGRATTFAPETTLSAVESDVRILVRCLPKDVVGSAARAKRSAAARRKHAPFGPRPQVSQEWALAQAVAELLEEQSNATVKVSGTPLKAEQPVQPKEGPRTPELVVSEPPPRSTGPAQVTKESVQAPRGVAGEGTMISAMGEAAWLKDFGAARRGPRARARVARALDGRRRPPRLVGASPA